MAKISELLALTSPAPEDLLLIVDNPLGTPVGKSVTVKNLFGHACNTSITGTLTVSGNTTLSGSNTVISGITDILELRTPDLTIDADRFVISHHLTPANSTTVGIDAGSIFFDSSYIYVRVSNTTIKRVALGSF